jgi:flagellar M-ring protein FliF
VAVLVDGKYEKDKYVARSPEEIELIKGVVKRAVGFDGERGDEIEVATVAFKVQPLVPLQPGAAPDWKDMLTSPIAIGAAVGALAVLGALVFLLTRRKRPPAPVEQPAPVVVVQPAPAATAQEVQDEITVVAQKFVLKTDPRKEQLTQIAKEYHDASVRIIRMWLQEDKARAAHEFEVNPERLN